MRSAAYPRTHSTVPTVSAIPVATCNISFRTEVALYKTRQDPAISVPLSFVFITATRADCSDPVSGCVDLSWPDAYLLALAGTGSIALNARRGLSSTGF